MSVAAGTVTADRACEVRKWGGWIFGVGIWLLPLGWIDVTTYLTLTFAGLTMGVLLFLTASGLTVIFGLMDVLNLTHGAFFAWGAYAGFSLLNVLDRRGWIETATMGQSLADLGLVLLLALLVGAVLGFILEKIIIRRTYGNHLKQILITMGGALVMAEIIRIFWGPNDEAVRVPAALQGSWDLYDVLVNKFRGVAILVGLVIFGAIQLVLRKTKLGIIVRAGVENKEIVQVLGYNIQRVFSGVFAAGAALAAMGGVMFAIFNGRIYPAMGDENLIFALIVVIIGGMGSVTGSFLGAIMVGLAFNYVAFLVPKLALGVNILIMAVILLIRPKGLLGRD
ncbi:MAG: branched-chain amino acid ABC transporter permease [Deltaproteobacteria bacterium]|nr:branched-chain amino acid ABC transporter permease [Deltaproteobacteria bacterium]